MSVYYLPKKKKKILKVLKILKKPLKADMHVRGSEKYTFIKYFKLKSSVLIDIAS